VLIEDVPHQQDVHVFKWKRLILFISDFMGKNYLLLIQSRYYPHLWNPDVHNRVDTSPSPGQLTLLPPSTLIFRLCLGSLKWFLPFGFLARRFCYAFLRLPRFLHAPPIIQLVVLMLLYKNKHLTNVLVWIYFFHPHVTSSSCDPDIPLCTPS